MGCSKQEYWSCLLFPSAGDLVLSELSTIIHPSWVALHGMAHHFIKLDKAYQICHCFHCFPTYLPWSDGTTGEGNGKPLQYSCLENPVNGTKRQRGRTRKDELSRSVGASVLLESSGELTPGRMKGRSQSKNNTQLWVWLVMEVKSDAVKSNIA